MVDVTPESARQGTLLVRSEIGWRLLIRDPLQQCPRLARALPPEAPEEALAGSSGFTGQTAAATVYIGDAQLADPGLPGRAARAAHIFAVYR